MRPVNCFSSIQSAESKKTLTIEVFSFLCVCFFLYFCFFMGPFPTADTERIPMPGGAFG